MNFFLLLSQLRLKATIRSAVFAVSAIFFLVLTLTLGLLLPREEQSGLRVGIQAQGSIAEQAVAQLERSEDYQLLRYDDEQTLRRDILRGTLHCGYLLTDDYPDHAAPITVLQPEDAFMRPLLDQMVFTAYFEASVPTLTRAYLESVQVETGGLDRAFAEVAQSAKPMVVTLKPLGEAQIAPLQTQRTGMQPMVYAVLVMTFTGVCLMNVLLQSPADTRALRQLSQKKRVAGIMAPICADVLLHFALLLVADFLLGALLGGQSYPLAARLTVFSLLAVFTALIGIPAAALRRAGTAVCVALPLWLTVGIVCSGALISPDKLPGALPLLRFLSPAWYALQILGI